MYKLYYKYIMFFVYFSIRNTARLLFLCKLHKGLMIRWQKWSFCAVCTNRTYVLCKLHKKGVQFLCNLHKTYVRFVQTAQNSAPFHRIISLCAICTKSKSAIKALLLHTTAYTYVYTYVYSGRLHSSHEVSNVDTITP